MHEHFKYRYKISIHRRRRFPIFQQMFSSLYGFSRTPSYQAGQRSNCYITIWLNIPRLNHFYLVVSTHLKSMLVKLDHETPRFGVKIKNMLNHHLDLFHSLTTLSRSTRKNRSPQSQLSTLPMAQDVLATALEKRPEAPGVGVSHLYLASTKRFFEVIELIDLGFFETHYPLGNDHIAGWNIPIFNRKYTFKVGPFSSQL